MVSNSENTNRKVIQDILSGLKENNADSSLSRRKVWSVIYRYAQLLIDRDARERKLYKNTDVYTPICVEMEEVSSILCTCFDALTQSTFYRSVEKLPKIFQTVLGPAVYSVTSIDGSKQVHFTTPMSARAKGRIRGNNNIYVFIDNGYLCSLERIEGVRITAMIEEQNEKFCCDCESKSTTCTNWLDQKTFIPDRLLSGVMGLVLQELMPTKQMIEDNNNNKTPNTESR